MNLVPIVKGNLNRYNTDKIAERHQYEAFYNGIVDELCLLARPKVMEIGVYFGASIRLWADIIPNVEVLGLDNERIWKDSPIPENVTYLITDAYTTQAVSTVKCWADQIDLIIDDGPHTQASQLTAALLYLPLLSPNGIMVIEDIATDSTLALLTGVVPEGYSYTIYNKASKQVFDERAIIIRRDA